MLLTTRFTAAFGYAAELHSGQGRKGTQIPYVSHLLAVASLVLEDGGDEDEAIAALLHDAVEDQGGRPTLERIRKRFGKEVASIVQGCTDAWTTPKPAWRKRKQRYLTHLQRASRKVLRVSAADKLHNARAIVADLRQCGSAVFERFNGRREGTLWYYRALADIYKRAGIGFLAEELGRVVTEMEGLASSPDAAP